jgi:hypothetical protein
VALKGTAFAKKKTGKKQREENEEPIYKIKQNKN